MDAEYGITGLGEVKWVLGMLIERDRDTRSIYISQEAFINTILARFNPSDAAPFSTSMIPGTHVSSADCPTSQEEKNKSANRQYRRVVRALSWLALGICPNITFATASLARFGHNPGCVHWEAAKRVLRYLRGTSGWRLKPGDDDPLICGFTDMDWVAIAMIVAPSELISSRLVVVPLVGNRRSRLAWLFCLQRPSIYVALCQVAKESEWMAEFLKGLVFRLTFS